MLRMIGIDEVAPESHQVHTNIRVRVHQQCFCVLQVEFPPRHRSNVVAKCACKQSANGPASGRRQLHDVVAKTSGRSQDRAACGDKVSCDWSDPLIAALSQYIHQRES